MKHLFIILPIIIISTFQRVNGAETNDSLQKYTYFVNGYLKGAWSNGSGSGFFIRQKKDLFFVTNYHVFTGYDPITGDNNPCDTIAIRLKKEKDSLFLKVSSNRDYKIENDIKSLRKADIIAIKLTKQQKHICDSIGVYNLSSFLDRSFLKITPRKIYFFGFPSNKVTYSQNTKMLVPSGQEAYGHFKEIDSTAYKLIARRNFTIDSASFQTKYRNLYFVFSDLPSSGGVSGSPIFGEFSINGLTTYKMMGIVRGGSGIMTEGIKGKEVLTILKERK